MQIVNTFKCNFSCEHCCYTCSSRRKEMLDMNTFNMFLQKYGNPDESINFCGGEIFLNPDWEKQLRSCLDHTNDLRIVTNGSLFYTRSGKDTKVLRKFTQILLESPCPVEIVISEDNFHYHEYSKRGLYPLSSVVHRFNLEDLPERINIVKDSRHDIFPLGRARRTQVYNIEGFCAGLGTFDPTLSPTGDIYACCNLKAKIGNIFDSPETVYQNWKNLPHKKRRTCLNCTL